MGNNLPWLIIDIMKSSNIYSPRLQSLSCPRLPSVTSRALFLRISPRENDKNVRMAKSVLMIPHTLIPDFITVTQIC